MEKRTCTLDGCTGPHKAHGLCGTHYAQARKRGEYRSRPTDIERFLAKVEEQPNGCLYWKAALTEQGYGQFKLHGRMMGAHRAAYLLFVGDIPEGFEVEHVCHSADVTCPGGDDCLHRRCVNPDPAHLEAITHAENTLRGRTVTAANAAKTHCPQGHPYDAANTYIYPSTGGRGCRACIAVAAAVRVRS